MGYDSAYKGGMAYATSFPNVGGRVSKDHQRQT